jgi:glucose/arabinose dehydrogenase
MHRLSRICFVLLLIGVPVRARADLPAGFVASPVGYDWAEPVGIAFDDNGRGYVWERGGRVFIIQNGVKLPTPLLDISDEVGAWRDHGMLGFALHPNFLANGYVYVLYVVDHHYLEFAGTSSYDPLLDDFYRATIGRITRYTARASDGFHTVDPSSRLVILGESASTGCPIVHQGHGVGSLQFGTDGTLLASCGDSASYETADVGGSVGGSYAAQALAEGIITPTEDVGAYRAQLLASHGGKILRLDPMTGNGVPSNPWYDPAKPRSPRSRVWELGVRNTFRFTVRPGTGSHDSTQGKPGTLYMGDVGWNDFEEIEVARTPGLNFGWPLYEGMDLGSVYPGVGAPANLEAPNPLFSPPACPIEFFRFSDLLVQESLAPPSFPNPCDPAVQIPASVPRFMHRRPDISYGSELDGYPMVTRTFTGDAPSTAVVGEPGSPVSGTQLHGVTSTGGVWYTASDFPAAWRNSYFHADYAGGWIANLHFDANDQPISIDPFWPDAGPIVALATSPTKGRLYAVNYATGVYEIAWAPGGDQPPVAHASADVVSGRTPLEVQFSSAGSEDPESQPLTYAWSFGDGSPGSDLSDPNHVFFAPVGVPTSYAVRLTVRDPAGQISSADLVVSVNNTPPSVSITSPKDQSLYALGAPITLPLTAVLLDYEHSNAELTCAWQTTLHHNTHVHTEPVDPQCATSAVIDPVGCDGNTYSYAFSLTVTDPGGLETRREVSIYPDCASLLPVICGDLQGDGQRDLRDVQSLRIGLAHGTANEPPYVARCSVIDDADCDIVDLTVLRRYVAGRAPGPAPVCPAANP